ncbi:hypothetical protein ACHMW7_19195 [Aminobacter sp. UC22_36]|uniref:hypothetical protein n=1 Tax=Aminobacter sp. UC22_36 TaxID=3374549 RepID=UPI0037577D3F
MDQINGLAAEPWDERPRDVFLGACASVAAGLAADGFSYARSGPRATRRDGPWKFALWFQSGRIGTYFAIHYLVHNKDFLAWRKQFAARAGQPDLVVSMNLGFLSPIRNWLDFDVAEPASRQDTIDLALANIRDHALPFFDLFRDPPALAQELTIRRHPGFFLEQQAVEFVAWTLGTEAAEQCVATHLDALAQCNGEALDLFRQGRDDKPHAQANVAVFLGQCARRLGLGANL